MIRAGVAGWDYADWDGVVSPRPRPRGFDPLVLLAEILDAVEVNMTFYRIPAPTAAASWERRTRSRPDFRFTVKLPKTFTHDLPAARGLAADPRAAAGGRGDSAPPSRDPDRDAALFRDAIAPLADAGRLGGVLVQFPQSFHPGEKQRTLLVETLERFSDLRLVVEFRHAGWGSEDTAELLRSRGAGFCNIDQPRLPSTLGPTSLVTGPVAYVRLHGRNTESWFREGAGRNNRYDYLYSSEELEPWVATARRIAAEGADTFVILNNHFRGKAVVNALQIKAALEGGLVTVPEPLLAAYPALSTVAKPPEGRLPF